MFSNKFRPKNIKQVIGKSQTKTAKFLMNRAVENNIIQAVLLVGPTGVGKTTVARLYADLVLCENPKETDFGYVPCGKCDGCTSVTSVEEINCSSNTGIDTIRTIEEKLHYTPLQGKYKIYILDEVHGLTKQAQNALLIPLENAPKHVVFILSTTEEEGILATLKGRCHIFNFPIPSEREQQRLVSSICKNQEKEVTAKELDEIIIKAGGNIRSLVIYTEQFIEGAFLDVDEEEDKVLGSVATLLFYGKTNEIEELFSSIKEIDNYDKAAIGLMNYALVVTKNPRDKRAMNKAVKILQEFGDGLPKTAIPRYAFMKRVLNVYNTN